MRILIVGKFPPIQGGVSWITLKTALNLHHKGIETYVVTNSEEVEPCFRTALLKDDISYLKDIYSKVGYRPIDKLEHPHIPNSKSYSERLFGKAIQVIDEIKPDLIIGWYFLPYGLVAAWVGLATSIPYVLIHAGSDLGRHSKNPNLKIAFSWMISNAKAIISSGNQKVREDLYILGATEDKIVTIARGILPLHPSFTMEKQLDINAYLSETKNYFSLLKYEDEFTQRLIKSNEKEFNNDFFTIGIYGKVGKAKGTMVLIQALTELAKEGYNFNFLAVSTGHYLTLKSFYQSVIDNTELSSRTWLLQAMAPWKIPEFIRTCNAVCFLENNFDIPYHTPSVPHEIIASGKCLVCSSEALQGLRYQSTLEDGNNCVVISDLSNSSELKERLKELICSSSMATDIGVKAKWTSDAIYEFYEQKKLVRNSMSDTIESILGDL